MIASSPMGPAMQGPLYIAVEGPIGVGKTTLVSKLSARLQARKVLEIVEENPFLAQFYSDRDRYAFQTQLFFLMSRFAQQEALKQGELFTPSTVSDYHLLKDRIFARLTLTSHELSLYERVYSALEQHILKPDVLIYLHAPLEVLLGRIKKRGRPFEQDFDPGYLSDLSAMYQHHFSHYSATPVLSLDTTDIDYVSSDEPVEMILQKALKLAGRLPEGSEGAGG